MYLGMESVVREHGFQKLEDAGDISGIHHSSFGVDEPSTVSRMLAWIDGVETDSRFFITYMPIAGHHPYETPEPGPFREEDEIDSYRNALHYCDAAIGQLLDGLQQRGLDQNTMLVIVGDHGQAFGQHEGNYGHTFFLYEENVRIPLMFVLPGMKRSQLVRRVASSIDVAPTVLELLGKESPMDFQGQSLLEPDVRMALFFTDYSLGLIGLRDRNWKFIYELESGRAKLFDLNSDPAEQHNLASENPDRVERYRDQLRRWIAAQRAVILGREKS
jgi:arylsulfatase A-like enzyme